MRCPTLAELPPPPPGKTGWPWTVESPQLPDAMPNGKPWPRISIVTPSYNQGQFIEDTIRSVLLQGYPNIEYFVMDGSSQDQSVKIIQTYEKWISAWESTPDRGQAAAINKGLKRFTGQIGSYLNSDDTLLKSSLAYVAEKFVNHHLDLLLGESAQIGPQIFNPLRRSHWLHLLSPVHTLLLAGPYPYQVCQESSFWSIARSHSEIFDEELHFCMDYDWFQRLAGRSKIMLSSKKIGYFRIHSDSKSTIMQDTRHKEIDIVNRKLLYLRIDESRQAELRNEIKFNYPRLLLKKIFWPPAEYIYTHP